MVFLGFLSSHPTQQQTTTRLHTEDVCFQLLGPVAYWTNSNSKASLTFYVAHFSILLHPPLSNPINLPLHHVPGGLQTVEDSAAGDCRQTC